MSFPEGPENEFDAAPDFRRPGQRPGPYQGDRRPAGQPRDHRPNVHRDDRPGDRPGDRRPAQGNRDSGGYRDNRRPPAFNERPIHQSSMAIGQLPLVPDDPERLPRAIVRTAILHPSIYRKRIDHIESRAMPGDWVRVEAADGQPLGFGIFNPKSEITVRIVFGPTRELIVDSWDRAFDDAIALRKDVLQLDQETDAYRVIHAEGDYLPGLVVDRFGDVLSAEIFSVGMWRRAAEIVPRLAAKLGTSQWLVRTGPNVLAHEGFDAQPMTSPVLRDSVTIQEFGTRFRVRFEESHKTGFFCDQRDNRKQLAKFCRDRTVLDLCCYTGGFSVQAKKLGGAAEVTGVELDEAPLKLAQENANLNQVRVKFVQADVFPYMRDMLRTGKKFDVVILDPPKLIRSRAELEEGTKKHFDLNRLAMQLVAPGGLLLSCTCAGLLPQEDFVRLLSAAARQAGDPIGEVQADMEFRRRGIRGMRFLAHSGAAADHPVASNCPESEYLHAAWMRLE